MRGGNSVAAEHQALAVVARTGVLLLTLVIFRSKPTSFLGFNTTKGALIRSMLFPKPMGFKFYRDSMRFIGFLSGLALLGFLVSAVQFIKLGVSSEAKSKFLTC